MKKFLANLDNLLIFIIRILFLINAVNNLMIKDYYYFLMAIAGMALTFIPYMYTKIFKRKENRTLSFSIVLFIFLSIYLGTLNNFYKFTWWDTMLHLVSGTILGFLAIVFMNNLNNSAVVKSLNPKFIFLYILSFVALCGVLWEVYEFTADIILGMDMQGVLLTGVTDTMEDLIADLIGGLIPAIYGALSFNKNNRIDEKNSSIDNL
ncbi:hypothetical protein [uncultured Clostridium sp.]|uniref:hypothetical protein n=1 Tax=uncultured Clostridium sp. TaxID=59620 RepID=UPI0028E19312|nr:hypothetical protein [uncultured Clostridium sp.]